ncbi:unnamed protein product [Darwinula stevensoni]|uniref:Uncharacterized protein n=1 Tax=Darwinula stevensoni TaxID=69355 RepID=A0A7R9A5S3_9CRUS|nr:unnamed protein product [Darwinula stevensoni]CAG0896063.1 unnamed protein product [Darwinula stevensoni]
MIGVIASVIGRSVAEKVVEAIGDECDYGIEEVMCKNCEEKFKCRTYKGQNRAHCPTCWKKLQIETDRRSAYDRLLSQRKETLMELTRWEEQNLDDDCLLRSGFTSPSDGSRLELCPLPQMLLLSFAGPPCLPLFRAPPRPSDPDPRRVGVDPVLELEESRLGGDRLDREVRARESVAGRAEERHIVADRDHKKMRLGFAVPFATLGRPRLCGGRDGARVAQSSWVFEIRSLRGFEICPARRDFMVSAPRHKLFDTTRIDRMDAGSASRSTRVLPRVTRLLCWDRCLAAVASVDRTAFWRYGGGDLEGFECSKGHP